MTRGIPRLDPTGPLMAAPEVANLLGVSVGHLAQLRYTGRGPMFIKMNGRAVRYRRIDVAAWLEQNLRSSTAGCISISGQDRNRPTPPSSTSPGKPRLT